MVESRWNGRSVISLCLGLLCFSAELGQIEAAKPKVAVATVQGPKRSGAPRLEKAMAKALLSQGVQVVRRKALRLGKRADGDAWIKGAERAGVPMVVLTTIRKGRGRFHAEAKLFSSSEGIEIAQGKKSYKNAKAATRAGAALGRMLAAKAKSYAPADASDDWSESVSSAEPSSIAPIIPEDDDSVSPLGEETSGLGPAKDPIAIKEDSEPAATAAETQVESRRRKWQPEDAMLRFGLAGGSQLASRYTVVVGGEVTGLAYSLSPLMMLGAEAGVYLDDYKLGFDLGFSYVPVRYSIDVEPTVDPNQPKGSFLDFSLTARYRLRLTEIGRDGYFALSPALGLRYAALSVSPQSYMGQEDFSVVLGWSSVTPVLGANLELALDERLILEATIRLGLIVSYGESPTTTGDGGGGLALGFGAGARYWILDPVGAFVRLGYDYQSIGMSGAGTRKPFVDDPPLVDASVLSSQFRVSVGAMVAF